MDATELHLEAGCGTALGYGALVVRAKDGNEFGCSPLLNKLEGLPPDLVGRFPEELHHRHLLCLPLLARGRSPGSDGEWVSPLRWWSTSAAIVCPLVALFNSFSCSMVEIREGDEVAAGKLGRQWSSRTIIWSTSLAILEDFPKSFALSRLFKPVRFFGEISTSFMRPLVSSAAERFAGTKTSGVVPVYVHGCSVQSSLLRGVEEEELDCILPSLCKAFLQKPGIHM
jgi:hypothetical protein